MIRPGPLPCTFYNYLKYWICKYLLTYLHKYICPISFSFEPKLMNYFLNICTWHFALYFFMKLCKMQNWIFFKAFVTLTYIYSKGNLFFYIKTSFRHNSATINPILAWH